MLNRTRQGGFSLIELLISFVVLLVGVLSVMTLFPLGMTESKAMMESSSAAFVARAARGYMEAYPFKYKNPSTKDGFGIASVVQIKFGPRWGHYQTSRFPIMFPEDVLGIGACDYEPFSIDQRPEWDSSAATASMPRIVDLDHPEYSWDARLVLGGGPHCPPSNAPRAMFPPKSLPPTADYKYVPGEDPENQYFNYDDVWLWRIQYFNYYAVQISVYRNYEEEPLDNVTLVTRADMKADGTAYEGTDPNRPINSEIVLSSPPTTMQLTVGAHVRFTDARSDWYEVKRFRFEEGKWVYRLDRRVTSGPGLNMELDSTQDEISSSRPDVIVTNSLIESFTTILPSQIDDMDTSNLSIPSSN